jgi:hypothetical protein
MEGEVCTDHTGCFGGEAVQQICGGVEPFYPVASWNRSLKEQGTQRIIDGANVAFDFTVLRRCVGARHPQNYPIGGEKSARGGIIELTAIVTLDCFDGAAKLCEGISEKMR